MLLKDYLENGGLCQLAKTIGIAPSFLNQISKGRRSMPPKYCYGIELATKGQVTRKDLRPSDWHKIWPELL